MITASQIKEYATSLGWHIVEQAKIDGLLVLNDPNGKYYQLELPIDNKHPFYEPRINDAINELAEFYQKSKTQIINEIKYKST